MRKRRQTAPRGPMIFESENHKLLVDVIAEQMGIEEQEVTLDSDVHEDLGFDSLDDVETVMVLEERLHIEIDDELIEKVKTVRDALAKLNEFYPRGAAPVAEPAKTE